MGFTLSKWPHLLHKMGFVDSLTHTTVARSLARPTWCSQRRSLARNILFFLPPFLPPNIETIEWCSVTRNAKRDFHVLVRKNLFISAFVKFIINDSSHFVGCWNCSTQMITRRRQVVPHWDRAPMTEPERCEGRSCCPLWIPRGWAYHRGSCPFDQRSFQPVSVACSHPHWQVVVPNWKKLGLMVFSNLDIEIECNMQQIPRSTSSYFKFFVKPQFDENI